jgi:hypothetical protein
MRAQPRLPSMPYTSPVLRILALALLVCSGRAAAQSAASSDEGAPAAAEASEGRTYVNARVGMASANENHRPEVCVEAAPLAFLSVEACGTGAQLWHDDPRPEMSHYRLKGRFGSWPFRQFWLQGFVGAGFAEMSVGADQAGFAFGGPSDARASTAGGELTLSLRALVPLRRGLELLADTVLAGAYLPHAPDLSSPRAAFQPSFAFSVGVGF